MTAPLSKRPTAGQLAYEHLLNNPDVIDTRDAAAEALKDYEAKFTSTLEQARKAWPLQDFYIEVSSKHEKMLGEAVQILHRARSTCPTPNYDQNVYVFEAKRQDVKLLWSIPNKQACLDLLKRHKHVLPEEEKLKDYVVQFAMGGLYKLAKLMNKEKHGLINPILYLKDNKENL